MSSFTSPLIVSPMPDGVRWKLEKSFQYHVGSRYSRHVISVPEGFVTDFASVPQLIITVLGAVGILVAHFLNMDWLLLLGIVIVLLAATMPRWGKYGKAAVLHDYLYETLCWLSPYKFKDHNPRKYADDVFYEAMLVSVTKPWKAAVMYRAVRLFGWLAWKGNTRKKVRKKFAGCEVGEGFTNKTLCDTLVIEEVLL